MHQAHQGCYGSQQAMRQKPAVSTSPWVIACRGLLGRWQSPPAPHLMQQKAATSYSPAAMGRPAGPSELRVVRQLLRMAERLRWAPVMRQPLPKEAGYL